MGTAVGSCWAGVDVGARRKGFHVAVVRDSPRGLELADRPRRILEPCEVGAWLRTCAPRLVGVDAPRQLGDHPNRFEGERALAREVCRLRYTPTRAALERQRTTRAPRFYEWIEHGLELYEVLLTLGVVAIEAFPTAGWTRWKGPRNGESRARWSERALRALAIRKVPRTLAQDERDAIGAAMIAWVHEAGFTEMFGDIVVPLAGLPRYHTSPYGTASRSSSRVDAQAPTPARPQ
jgi:predicted nuclease with RNAse H fold